MMWFVDMVLQCFVNWEDHRSSQYDLALTYMKSTLIIDLIALLPTTISGLHPSFVIVKFIRLYRINLLYYPCQAIVDVFCFYRESQYIYIIIYCF